MQVLNRKMICLSRIFAHTKQRKGKTTMATKNKKPVAKKTVAKATKKPAVKTKPVKPVAKKVPAKKVAVKPAVKKETNKVAKKGLNKPAAKLVVDRIKLPAKGKLFVKAAKRPTTKKK